jgi:hypothetical protein
MGRRRNLTTLPHPRGEGMADLSEEDRCPEELVLVTGVVNAPRKAWRCTRPKHGDESHLYDGIASSGQVFSVYWDGPTPKFSETIPRRDVLSPPRIRG